MKVDVPSFAPGASPDFLEGKMLIAMPSMQDERFSRTLIYVCAHSPEGAMGIVVNQPATHIRFADLLVQLNVVPAEQRIQLPKEAGSVKVLKGGAGGDGARLRAAFGGLFHREFDARHRGRHLPHRHARYPEGHCQRHRTRQCGSGPRLCGVGAGTA